MVLEKLEFTEEKSHRTKDITYTKVQHTHMGSHINTTANEKSQKVKFTR